MSVPAQQDLIVPEVRNTPYHGASVLTCLAAGAIAAVISFATYAWYEKPFLRLKNRFTAVPPEERGVVLHPIS